MSVGLRWGAVVEKFRLGKEMAGSNGPMARGIGTMGRSANGASAWRKNNVAIAGLGRQEGSSRRWHDICEVDEISGLLIVT